MLVYFTWSVNPDWFTHECLAHAVSFSWPLFQSALGFSLMCAQVKEEKHWVLSYETLVRGTAKDTDFLHLLLVQLKQEMHLLLMVWKHWGLKLPSTVSSQLDKVQGFPTLFSSFPSLTFPSASLFCSWSPLLGKVTEALHPRSFPKSLLSGLLFKEL